MHSELSRKVEEYKLVKHEQNQDEPVAQEKNANLSLAFQVLLSEILVCILLVQNICQIPFFLFYNSKCYSH